MNPSCILLNGDYTYLGLVDWKKAMCLVFADKVKVLKYSNRIIRGVEKVFRAPAVLVLIKVVRSVYRGRVPFSKKNILVRLQPFPPSLHFLIDAQYCAILKINMLRNIAHYCMVL